MKLIEANKVEQAIKDYWKAQVDRAPIPKSTKEYNAYVNCLDAILERNDGLLKAIDELPSAQPEIIRCKDCVYQTESWSGIKYCEAHGDHIGKDYDYCSNARRKENG